MSTKASASTAARAWKLFRIASILGAVCLIVAAVAVFVAWDRVSRASTQVEESERARLEQMERAASLEQERDEALETIETLRGELGSASQSIARISEDLSRTTGLLKSAEGGATRLAKRLEDLEEVVQSPWETRQSDSPWGDAGELAPVSIRVRIVNDAESTSEGHSIPDEESLVQLITEHAESAGFRVEPRLNASSWILDVDVKINEAIKGSIRRLTTRVEIKRASLDPGLPPAWSLVTFDSSTRHRWATGTMLEEEPDAIPNLLIETLESLFSRMPAG